jgi:Zn-dependent alcohol dehydrogenase
VKPGEWIAISGIGGLGHMAVQYAKAMGLHVTAVDLHPEKLALAAQLGADLTVLRQLSLPTHAGIIIILIVGLALLLRTCTPMDPARHQILASCLADIDALCGRLRFLPPHGQYHRQNGHKQ